MIHPLDVFYFMAQVLGVIFLVVVMPIAVVLMIHKPRKK